MQWAADLELPFVKAPYENLSRVFRNVQKQTEKEISQLVNQVSDLNGKKDQLSRQEAYDSLGKLAGRLQGLKRKASTLFNVFRLLSGIAGPANPWMFSCFAAAKR